MMQAFDLFGSVFNFTIDRKRKFKTSFGGILTIFSFLLCVSISFLLGRDFYYKTNPKVLLQNGLLNDHEKRRISNENLTIAWRIEDYAGNKQEHEGIFFPKFNFLFYEVDPTQNNKTVLQKEIPVNIKKCSEIKEINEDLAKSISLDKWYCMDFSSIEAYFGGYWNSEFIYLYKLSFETCKEEKENKTKCANITQLKEFVKQEVYLSLMLPEVAFYYDNLDEPFQTVYRNSFTSLDLRLSRSQQCDFQQVFFEDDQGIIFKTNFNTTGLSLIGSCDLSSNYIPESEYAEGHNVVFYSLEFYLRMSFVYSKRTFMKIQELAAIMGGFFNLIYILVGFLNWSINVFERDMLLMNAIFKFNKEEEDIKNKFTVFKEYNQEMFRKLEVKKTHSISAFLKSEVNHRKITEIDVDRLSIENSLNSINNQNESNNNINTKNVNKTITNHINSFDSKIYPIGNYFEMENSILNNIIYNNNKKTDLISRKNFNNYRRHSKKSKNLNDLKEIKISSLIRKEINKNKIYNNNIDRSGNNQNFNKILQTKDLKTQNFKNISDTLDDVNSISKKNNEYKKPINKLEPINKFNINTSNENAYIIKELQNNLNYEKMDESNDKTNRGLITSVTKRAEKINKSKEDDKNKNKNIHLNESSVKIDIYKKYLNVREMIQNSKDLFNGISFCDYLCPSLCIKNNKIKDQRLRVLKAFNDGKYYLDKKLDLFIYLDNLYLLKLISKFILNRHQRFYFKNNYMYLLDLEESESEKDKLLKNKVKSVQMIQYIEQLMDKNFKEISETDKLIIENIFNQGTNLELKKV